MHKNSIKKIAFIIFSLILINSFIPILNATIFGMDLDDNSEIISEEDNKIETEEMEIIKENENEIIIEEDTEKSDKLDLFDDNNKEKVDYNYYDLSEESITEIYVDSQKGDDSSNGDIDNPLKSLDLAIEMSNNCVENTNIYLYPGDYNVSLVDEPKIYTSTTIKGLGNKNDICIKIIGEESSGYFNIFGIDPRIDINIENLSISNSENVEFIMFNLYNVDFNMENIALNNEYREERLEGLGTRIEFITENSNVELNNIINVYSIIVADDDQVINNEGTLIIDNITFSGDRTGIDIRNYKEATLSNINNIHSIEIDQVESLELDNVETVCLIEEDGFIMNSFIKINSNELILKNINTNSIVENYLELIVLGNKINLENICLSILEIDKPESQYSQGDNREISLKDIKISANESINGSEYTKILVFEEFGKVDIEDVVIENYTTYFPIVFASDINNLRINNLFSKNNINNLISLDHVKNFDIDNINIEVDKVLAVENEDEIQYGIHTHTFDCQNPISHKSAGFINNYKVNMINKNQLSHFNNFFENSNIILDRINVNVDNNLINNACFHAINSDIYLRNSKIGNKDNKTTLLLDIVNSNLNLTNNSIIDYVLGSNNCILQNDLGEEIGKIKFEKGNANNIEFNNNILDIKVNNEVDNFQEIDNVYLNIKDNSEFNNNILLNLKEDDLEATDKENIFITDINEIGFKSNDLDILSTSIAVDKGDNNFVDIDSKKDLRGNDRIFNNIVDIGAYEYTKSIEYPNTEDNDTQQSYPESNNGKVKIIYDANGGLVQDKNKMEVRVSKGSIITEKVTAERRGYIFKGWSKVKDEEELFDFKKPVNKDITLYALWEEDKDKDKLDKINHFEYIQGYPDRSVRPENNISREEVSAVFYRLLNEDYKQSIYTLENNFKDLSNKRWSNKHISTLANGNILTGYEDGEVKYNNFITRAELATIASRFEDLDESSHNFTDIKGHWAEEYIASASKKGWVEGYKDGSFRPDKYITRAEFVTLVNRVLNRGVKKENILEGIKEFKDLKDNTWYYEEFVEAINGHTFDRDNEKDRTSEKWLELKEFNMDM